MLSSKSGRNPLSDNNASESMGWGGGDRESRIIRRTLLERISNNMIVKNCGSP